PLAYYAGGPATRTDCGANGRATRHRSACHTGGSASQRQPGAAITSGETGRAEQPARRGQRYQARRTKAGVARRDVDGVVWRESAFSAIAVRVHAGCEHHADVDRVYRLL